jgi:hypothetical protein
VRLLTVRQTVLFRVGFASAHASKAPVTI